VCLGNDNSPAHAERSKDHAMKEGGSREEKDG